MVSIGTVVSIAGCCSIIESIPFEARGSVEAGRAGDIVRSATDSDNHPRPNSRCGRESRGPAPAATSKREVRPCTTPQPTPSARWVTRTGVG